MVNLYTIIDYIRKLSPEQKTTLYTSPIFSTSIIKIFNDSVIRLIFDLLLTAPSIKSLQKNEELKDSLKVLLRLQLIVKKGNNIYLNDTFRESFLKGSELNINYEYFKLIDKDKNLVDTTNKFEEITKDTTNKFEEITKDTTNKFEEILKFLVTKEKSNINNNYLDVLVDCKLIDDNQDITNTGFEFLLKPRYEQYWYLVISALKYYCKDELGNFMSIIEMSNLSIGSSYNIIKSVDKKFYSFLSDIGVLSIKNNILIIYHNLFVKHDSEKSKFLLLETNYKLYAYTSSIYEKSIIELFADVYLILPNLIKGNLTEESLSNAFSKGVTSHQIINFIKTYSLYDNIPDTVLNQIEIWELKRKRIRILPGYLYSNFLSLVDYQKFIKFCLIKDCIIDKDDDRRMVIIKIEYNNIVKEYVKNNIIKH